MSEKTPRREVTKEEMLAHVAAWPRPLKKDVFAAGEPPMVTWNDFTYGNWPESIVARYFLEGYGPEDGYAIVRELPG